MSDVAQKGAVDRPSTETWTPGHGPDLSRAPWRINEASDHKQRVDWQEFWQYRELLYFLVWKEIKVRYKQTALGVIWAVLQPVMTMVVFSIFFGRLAGLGRSTNGIPYPVYVYAGLLPWTFFATAIGNSTNALVGNTNLITKVYFPRVLVPLATIFAGLVDFVLSFGVLPARCLRRAASASCSPR
jgi:lipopolysaccharide transport system permease protein